jgi:hypothetical protein
VDAALPEVAVERAVIAVPIEERAELAEVLAHAVRRHRRVLPSGPGVRRTRHARRRRQPRLAHLPDHLHLLGVGEDLRGRRRARPPLEVRDAPARRLLRLLRRLPTELDEEVRLPPRVEVEVPRVDALLLHVLHERVVHALEADGAVLADPRDVVPGPVHVLVAENGEHARRRAVNELELRLEHEHAGTLGAHERARHLETSLGQELVEVVTRDATGDVRVPAPDLRGVPIPELAEVPVDLPPPATRARRQLDLRLGRRADPHPLTVVCQHLEAPHVVGGASRHHRVDAAGVVPDHAPERAVSRPVLRNARYRTLICRL